MARKRKIPEKLTNPNIERDVPDPRQHGLRILAALIAERHFNSVNGSSGKTVGGDKAGGDKK